MATSKTVDGVEIEPGMRVFTTSCRWGTVQGAAWTEGPNDDVWWNVHEDGVRGNITAANGERLCTRDNISHTTDPEAEAQRERRRSA